jgi:hypothetical protein
MLIDTCHQVTPPQLMPLPWNTSNAAPNNNNGEANEAQQYEKTAPNKRRKLNKKKHKDNLPGLLFANHWKLRQSSVQLYDKVRYNRWKTRINITPICFRYCWTHSAR